MRLDEITKKQKAADELKTLKDSIVDGYITIDMSDKPFTGMLALTGLGLRSLKGIPKLTENSTIYASNNRITSLEGCPDKLDTFIVNNNSVTNLVGGPTEVEKTYNIVHNKLTSLKGAPRKCGSFLLNYNRQLAELDYLPEELVDHLEIIDTNITSLSGIDKKLKRFTSSAGGIIFMHRAPIKYGIVGLLRIENLRGIRWNDSVDKDVVNLINEYLMKTDMRPNAKVIECTAKLVDMGYDDLARL